MAASIKSQIDRISRLVWAMTSLAFVCTALTGAGVSLIHAADQDLEKLNRFVQSSNSSSAAMTAFREGRDLINKEEWAKAADKFNQIVTRYPNSEVTDAALYWLAFSLKRQNKFQETDDTLGRLIRGFPRSNWIKDAKAMKAEIALHLGRGESVTEEIHREYKLSPGARVEVSNINGPVEIETADTDMAEVHIVRSARTQTDLLDHKVIIEQTSAGLVVRGDPELDWLRRGIPDSDFLTRLSRDPSGFDWLRHGREVVTLKLPQQVDLSIKQINSRIKVGKIKGATQLIGVNGRAEVADLEGSAEASGINGGLNIAIAHLGERGILVRGINGGAELNFANGVNAELDVGVVTGGVYVDVPDVTPLKINKDVISRAKIGAGGAPITISGVNGSVRIRGENLGENTRPFKGLANSFASNPNPITAPDEPIRKLEESHREYRLSPGARVEVSNINGPVEIETADTDLAEVHITRFAQGLADVNDRKLKIVDTPNSLTIHAEGNSLRMGGNEVRHRVALKIPRRVDLTINHVSDLLKVGEIDGSIHLNGLSWKADMSLAAGQIEISRVSGTAVIRFTKLDEQGINISNVSGKVELLAPADLNANIDVNGNHGKVIIGLPHKLQEGTLNGLRFRAQIGSGGAPISISNIIGTVSLRQM